MKINAKMTKCLIVLALAFGFVGASFAADTKSVNVAATIAPQNGLTVTVSKVVGTAWTSVTTMDMGSLVFDTTNKIFTTGGGFYYAVDVGVNSNAADWTVTHKTTSITNGTTNLDSHINVGFFKQTSSSVGTQLDMVSYANSNNKSYTKSQLAGGWLRIYYGVATGATTDAPGTTPVSTDVAPGNYAGTVTITLTP